MCCVVVVSFFCVKSETELEILKCFGKDKRQSCALRGEDKEQAVDGMVLYIIMIE